VEGPSEGGKESEHRERVGRYKWSLNWRIKKNGEGFVIIWLTVFEESGRWK
jgi:hypothetical protein